MLDLKKIQADHKTVLDEMESTVNLLGEMKGKSDPSEDDKKKVTHLQGKYDELKGKADSLEIDISIAKDLAERRKANKDVADLAGPEDKDKKAPFNGKTEPDDADSARAKVWADARAKNQAAREIEKYFYGFVCTGNQNDIPDKALDVMRPQGKGWKEAAEGIKCPPHMSRLMLGPDPALTAKAYMSGRALEMPGTRGKAVGDDPFLTSDANFPEEMFPPEFMSELLSLPPEPTNLFQRARKVPTKSGTVRWPKVTRTDTNEYGGIVVDWIAEGGEKAKTEPIFEQVTIQTHELAARTELSRTLLNRSIIDLNLWLAQEFRAALMNAKDIAFQTGSGTGRPLGVFNTSGLRVAARTTAGTVEYEDLVTMEHALRINHRANAVWLIADDVMEALRKKKDTDGRPLFVPNVLTGAFDTIFGKPVIQTERLTIGDDDVLYGDWRQYIVPIEQDVVIMRSDHRKIENNIVVFVAFIQCGGRVVQERAFVRLGDTSGS